MDSHRQSTEYSLWLFIGILLGWGVSRLLVDEFQYYEPGDLILSGAALSAGLLLGPVISVLRDPDSSFRVEFILTAGIVYWLLLDAIQGAYGLWGVSRQSILKSFDSVAIFALALWLGSVATGALKIRVKKNNQQFFSSEFLSAAIVFCFLAGSLRVFMSCNLSPSCIVDGLLAERGAAAWQVARFGNWDTFLIKIQLFGYLILPFTIALRHIEGRTSWRVVVGYVFGVFIILILLQGGGRRQIGMMLGATTLVWILLNRPIDFKKLAFSLVLLLGLVYVMEQMLVWRNEGFGAMFEKKEVDDTHNRGGLIHVDKNLRYMTYVMDIIPDRHPHTGWEGLYSIVVAPVPRSALPSKPLDYLDFELLDYVPLNRSPYWSWTCTSICDFYVIGGFFGVFVGGLLFGGMARLCNGLLSFPVTTDKVLFYGVSTMTLFVSLRAARELTVMGIAVLALWGLVSLKRMLSGKLQRRRAVPEL